MRTTVLAAAALVQVACGLPPRPAELLGGGDFCTVRAAGDYGYTCRDGAAWFCEADGLAVRPGDVGLLVGPYECDCTRSGCPWPAVVEGLACPLSMEGAAQCVGTSSAFCRSGRWHLEPCAGCRVLQRALVCE